jgi:polyisoprenyl-teichoic acid--peptidoglycan teichoic acid transferase
VSPEDRQGNGEEEHRPDETEEWDAEEEAGGVYDGHEDLEDEETPEEEGVDEEAEEEEESELDQLIAAETAEWEGIDAAEAEASKEVGASAGADAEEASEDEDVGSEDAPPDAPDEQEATLVAAAGQRLGEARSTITSGFERIKAGEKLGAGAQKVRGWRPGFPLWLRFITASLAIVVSIAAATAASLIVYLEDIAEALEDQTGELAKADKFLTQVDGGDPQTIMILGSDKRPEDKKSSFKGLSDTTMLLRLDPDRNALALFSLPRDLQVEIPGRGTAKLNEAYAYGGPELTLRTVEELLSFPGREFEVNHLVNVDFEGFARAVNEIDCVYVDVDRRYFHSNDNTSALEDYEEIDLQPGYQALCGFDALDYARYRHTDNDIIRAARQQEFLREARAKVPPDRLIEDRKDLISIFTQHTTSDINDADTMLQVLKLFLDARDAPIKEVHFEGTIGPSFVTTTTEELQGAVDSFFGFRASGGEGQTATPDAPVTPEAAPDETPVTAPDEEGDEGEDGEGDQEKAKPKPAEPSSDGPVDDAFSLTQTQFGRELARGIRARVPKLPIYYPTALETGSDFDQKPRVYKVNGTGPGSPPQGERAAYKWVFSRPLIGEYYGFMATAWKDPPILDDPDTTREIGDREYDIYFDGDRVRMIAWDDDRGSYWVSNTLIESLSDREMLKIAQGMRELPRAGG